MEEKTKERIFEAMKANVAVTCKDFEVNNERGRVAKRLLEVQGEWIKLLKRIRKLPDKQRKILEIKQIISLSLIDDKELDVLIKIYEKNKRNFDVCMAQRS